MNQDADDLDPASNCATPFHGRQLVIWSPRHKAMPPKLIAALARNVGTIGSALYLLRLASELSDPPLDGQPRA